MNNLNLDVVEALALKYSPSREADEVQMARHMILGTLQRIESIAERERLIATLLADKGTTIQDLRGSIQHFCN